MKNLLLLTAGLALGMSAMAQTPTKFDCVADTWIRQNDLNYSGSTTATLEVNSCTLEDGTPGNFSVLYGFNFNVPSGQKVQSATLHIVTARYKGGTVDVFGYPNNFSETNTWADEASYISQATSGNYLVQFTPAGQWNKDIGLDEVEESKQNLESWTNELDVTAYVKSLPTTAKRVNFFLTNGSAQNCFYSRDNQGTDAFKYYAAEDTNHENPLFYQHFNQNQLMPYLEVTFVEDSETSEDVLTSTADTWIYKGDGSQRGGGDSMEIYTYYNEPDDGGDVVDKELYGLISFNNVPVELFDTEHYTLTGAELRLTTTFIKQSRGINLYDYPHFFDEGNVNFATEESYVREALANEPVLSFEAAGQVGKAPQFDSVDEEYQNVAAWQNYIDLTDFLADRIANAKSASDLCFSFLIEKDGNHSEATKFATKEAVPFNIKDTEVTFTVADLKPMLTIAYSKVAVGDNNEDETAVEVVVDLNAPAEYFNLNGVKVQNPDKGIYIVRQGNTVKKVVL